MQEREVVPLAVEGVGLAVRGGQGGDSEENVGRGRTVWSK